MLLSSTKEGKSDYAWATSWGVSTRLIGALIMSHSDDNGLVLPPHLAPIQVVIVPIYRSEEQLAQISEKVNGIVAKLKKMGISVKYDDADNKKPGWKFAEYELKGVPVRLAMGGRDLENQHDRSNAPRIRWKKKHSLATVSRNTYRICWKKSSRTSSRKPSIIVQLAR